MASSPWRNKRTRLVIRWVCVLLVSTAVVGAIGFFALRPKDPYAAMLVDKQVEGLTNRLVREAPSKTTLRFAEEASVRGLQFRHFPDRRASLLPEDMGSGLAWGDYDGDGAPDLYAVNFQHSILRRPGDAPAGRCQLFRNLGGRFIPVGEAGRVAISLYGMGAAWADLDNDGFNDLYVTAYGDNRLFLNNLDGTFTDITTEAGVNDTRFSSSAVWADYDRDGDLDLYVCNYVEFRYSPQDLGRTASQYGEEIPFTINPSVYPPQPNALFRNDGSGRFEEVAAQAGVDNPQGKSLAAAWFDFDNDGWLDLYVANDISANAVYRNRGDGSFEDIGAISLAADYRGAMGLAVGDLDNDFDLDMVVTHWLAQENACFINMVSKGFQDETGKLVVFFMDQSDRYGIDQVSIRMVGWATSFADFDNDGDLDLWVVNGDTLQDPSSPHLLRRQHLHLFEHRPPEGFFPVTDSACPALREPFVGRGGAHADFDGDGRVDLAVLPHGETLKLLHNTSQAGSWLRVRLLDEIGNRSGIGARIVVRCGDHEQMRQLGCQGPYLSQNEQVVHFGLGKSNGPAIVEVVWPDGAKTAVEPQDLNKTLLLRHLLSTPGGAAERRSTASPDQD